MDRGEPESEKDAGRVDYELKIKFYQVTSPSCAQYCLQARVSLSCLYSNGAIHSATVSAGQTTTRKSIDEDDDPEDENATKKCRQC